MDKDTYIILDIPEPLSSQIMAFRHHLQRTVRPDIPPGIGGAGPLAEEQDEAYVLAQLEALLPTAYPIQTAFIYTAIFPNTTMVYLVPRDHAPFATLTDHILACGIRVIPNLFMKVAIPHCTVAWFEEHAEQEIAKALSFPAPTEELVFDTLSMYTIVPSGVVRHWTGKLPGNTPLQPHKL